MSAEQLLLDTHAVLWWQASSDRLSRRASAAIDGADRLWISAISLWEIATLVRLGRIGLDRPLPRWTADLLAGPLGCIDVDPAVAVDAGAFETVHGDPADRIILATAREHRLTLVTKDRRLADHATSHGSVTVLW